MQNLVNILESATLKELYREFGIQTYQELDQGLEPLEVSPSEPVYTSRKNYAKQEVIGQVGTYVIDGRLKVEANSRMAPFFARGRRSVPGLLEKIYRAEPVVFNSVNSTSAIVRSATFDPTPTGDMDQETTEIMLKAHSAIMGIESGFRCFMRDATCTLPKIGFVPFEAVWDSREDGIWIDDILFREPATLERWVLNQKGDLSGAEFSVSGDRYFNYALPYGNEPDTSKLHIMNVNGTGNNWEGVSPVRVAAGIRALKELLLNVSGLSYQKYGVPIVQVIFDLVNLNAADLAAGSENDVEVQALINRLNNLSAQIAGVLKVPAGYKVEVAAPTNTMPDIKPMLEYLDSLMALCFSNEGSVIGGSFGSYALASVADNRFMRIAPVYAESIADFLTRLMHQMIKWNHSDPDKIQSLPEYNFRFSGTQDASKWNADMAVLIASQVWNWPEEARQHASVNMGFSADTFNDWGPMSADISGQQEAPMKGVDTIEPLDGGGDE